MTLDEMWHEFKESFPGLSSLSAEEAALKAFASGLLRSSAAMLDLPTDTNFAQHAVQHHQKVWAFFAKAFHLV